MGGKISRDERRFSRRDFLSTALAAPIVAADAYGSLFQRRALARPLPSIHSRGARFTGPDGRLQLELLPSEEGRLSYLVTMDGELVIDTSSVSIVIDGVDLGHGTHLDETARYRTDETYAWRGVHSVARNHCNGATVAFRHVESGTDYTLEIRMFDDAVAFRHVVPGEGTRTPDDGSSFAIPAGSTVWFHDFEGHYEGSHVAKEITEIEAGEWAAPPVTFKLPGGRGYASITEAALVDYSGLGLQADGQGGFRAVLGHAHPPSYPFTLRYGDEEAERLSQPATISGPITTPWRVVMIGRDLNTLVNTDVLHNLSPPPDPQLFPDGIHTEWVRPGRCVWKYLDGGENTLEEMKTFSRLAGELGFEYNVIEGFWQRWSESELRELVEYSRGHDVGIWLWKHTRDLREPEARRAFFSLCRKVGAVGAKLDFFDHEAREVVDLYHALLRDAAEFEIMVNFHGANKPTGESRTWPNEMNREAISGMERRSMEAWSRHNSTLPFTRMLAGHADFTPMLFGERRRETSWAHQIASAAILTAPALVYGAHPATILENPAAEMIKSIPTVWDETLVLPVSEIGEIAAYARRRGEEWFLAIMNGPEARSVILPLDFLGAGNYEASIVRDREDDAAAVEIDEGAAAAADRMPINLRAGGGFIARFRK